MSDRTRRGLDGEPGDGRLELDELGSVVEEGDGPAVAPEVLGEEPQPWAERLRRSGPARWVARHRLTTVLAGLVALALLAGGVRWEQTRPPPMSLTLPTVVLAGPEGNVAVVDDGRGVAAAGYRVTTAEPGADVTAVTLLGPGIRATRTTGPSTDGSVTVDAVLGCDGDGLRARADQYVLAVTTTDAWGRARVDEVLPPGDGPGWADVVARRCWERTVPGGLSVVSIDATEDVGAAAVVLVARVRSALPVPALVWVEPAPGDDASLTTWGSGSRVDPGATVSAQAQLDVTSCSPSLPSLPTVAVPPDPVLPVQARYEPGLVLSVRSPDEPGGGAALPVAFTAQQQQELRALLASVCRGAPTASLPSVHVLGTGLDPADGTIVAEVATTVSVPAGRLAVASIAPDAYLYVPTTADRDWQLLPPGGGTVTLPWRFSCTSPPRPPRVDLRFVDSLRPTPLSLAPDPESLVGHVTAACPQLSARDLVEVGGWRLP